MSPSPITARPFTPSLDAPARRAYKSAVGSVAHSTAPVLMGSAKLTILSKGETL
jgi:hypothetical protein